MQCYSELIPPTAVSHSLSLPFLSASANNLIVARTSLLQVYSLKSVISHTSHTTPRDKAQDPHEAKRDAVNDLEIPIPDSATLRGERFHTTKLVLLAQYELSGTITSLARVKLLQSKSGGEALLVALRDAKLSLVEWDPERFSISTISIHYYEREDIFNNPWEPDLAQCSTILSVDPSSRCAVLKFGARHIAILPFHQVGDDLVMDDVDDEYDPNIDGERPERKNSTIKDAAANATNGKTPYAASFVLSLMALDPSLSHPIHLSFLHEYREPTFGVLYSEVQGSLSLLHERRDNVSYSVYTLDLDQRASTTLLSVSDLPYDLSTIVPLSRTIGGALLLGGNEIIHVDQSGKTNGIAVNEFARQSTSFGMVDQSDLNIKLEHCIVKELGTTSSDLLVVLDTGELTIFSFKIDGRSVSGMSMRRVDAENGGRIILSGASCTSTLGRGRLFVGSELSDSVVLGWSKKSDRSRKQLSRKKSDLEFVDDELDEDEEESVDDEDDLYGEDKPINKDQDSTAASPLGDAEDYIFRIHDSLINLGPMTDIAPVKTSGDRKDTVISDDSGSSLGLVITSGRGRAGGLTKLHQDILLDTTGQDIIANVKNAWSIHTKNPANEAAGANRDVYDTYMFATSAEVGEEEKPSAYRIHTKTFEEVKDTEIYDADAGNTIEVGMLNGATIIAQVTQTQVRTYDPDFGLAQIYPLTDEEIETAEPKVISASFADPYILVVRDDASATVLSVDDRGEIDEATKGDALKGGKWLSGSLYEDSDDYLRLEYPEESEDEAGNVLMFLLSEAGGLQVFRLPNLQKPVYVADGLSYLPPFLSAEFTARRSSAKESLVEILMAEIGDAVHKAPYLILRSASDDLTIYQPYQSPIEGSKETNLRFLKVPNTYLPRGTTRSSLDSEQQVRRQPLRASPNLGGYSVVVKPGSPPSLIIKSGSSQVHEIAIQVERATAMASLHTSTCHHGLMYIDGEGRTRTAQLPQRIRYDTGWATQSIPLGEEIYAFSYHEEQDTYILGTTTTTDFKLPEDDYQHQRNEEESKSLPRSEQGSIKLLDDRSLLILDSHTLDPHEIPTTIKTLSLETSEITHQRQLLVAVGTTFLRGEDTPSPGQIYVFAVITVVPDPDLPHTNRAFKLIAKEEVKGAVTALSSVGTQGFLLVAQGQKIMVRGLKEDGTLLPVAFMDVQCYTSVARELPGSGLCILGDARMGARLIGYMEEPYQLRLFSKTSHHIEVIAADFLPDGKQLYMVIADADCNLHILQFDPEHPKSLTGTRLLHHTTFHTGHFPSTLTLLSPSPSPSQNPSHSQPHRILLTTQTGSLSLVTPLPTSHSQRLLSSLQSHVQNTLPHHLGLNPRGYRSATSSSSSGGGGSGAIGVGSNILSGEAGLAGPRGGVVDGGLVKRWMEGGRWRWWGSGEGGGSGGEGGEGVREVVRGVGRL